MMQMKLISMVVSVKSGGMNRKFLILACVVGVGWGISASAQPAPTGSDDQDQALRALRRSENAPSTNQPPVSKAAQKPPAKQQILPDQYNIDNDKEVREAIAEKARIEREAQKEEEKEAAKRRREQGELDIRPAKKAPPTPAPADAPVVPAADDQNQALNALRHSQATPIMADQSSPAAAAAAVPTVPPLEATPVIAPPPSVEAAPVAAPAAPAPVAESTSTPSRIVAPEPAITAPGASDDQNKALETLRRAEAQPLTQEQVAPAAAPETPAAPPAAVAPPSVEAAPPVAAAPVVQPAPVITAMPESSDDQSKALETLRRAEAEPLVPNQTASAAPAASTPAVRMTTEAPSGSVSIQDKEAQLVEAQRRRQAAEEQARADVAAQEDAAVRQQKQDELKLQQAIEAEKAAAEQARIDKAAQEEMAKKQREQDEFRVQQAIEAEKAAVEEARIAKAQREAAAAAAEQARIAKAQQDEAANAVARKKAQDEVARRVGQLGRDAQNAPAQMNESPAFMSAKEQKLADLLRRYQADQITPYDYHTERAKIIAEP
jgi:hypothetical protein